MSNIKLKIIYIVNVDWFFISHRLPIALQAIELGHEVHLVCKDTGRVSGLTSLGIVVHPIAFNRSGKSILQEIRVLRELHRLFKSLQPDIIHAVTIKPVLYSGLVLHLLKDIPAVFAVSGLGYTFSASGFKARLFRVVATILYRVAFAHRRKKVIFQNDHDERTIRGITSIKESEIVRIKGSGVDLSRYKNHVEPHNEKLVVTFASRLLKEKGVLDFVVAARTVKKNCPSVVFQIAGPIDLENPNAVSEDTVLNWHEEGVVKYIGNCDNIPEVFSQSHVVVLPSYYGEGVPKVLIEAAACGRAIVTTDQPGCRDAVIDGETGILVPARAPSELASAIERLLIDSELRRTMGANARAFAEREFDVRQVVEKHIEVYRELLSSRQS